MAGRQNCSAPNFDLIVGAAFTPSLEILWARPCWLQSLATVSLAAWLVARPLPLSGAKRNPACPASPAAINPAGCRRRPHQGAQGEDQTPRRAGVRESDLGTMECWRPARPAFEHLTRTLLPVFLPKSEIRARPEVRMGSGGIPDDRLHPLRLPRFEEHGQQAGMRLAQWVRAPAAVPAPRPRLRRQQRAAAWPGLSARLATAASQSPRHGLRVTVQSGRRR